MISQKVLPPTTGGDASAATAASTSTPTAAAGLDIQRAMTAILRDLPRPNPFRAFLYDECGYVWVTIAIRKIKKLLILAKRYHDSRPSDYLTLWNFLQLHCRIDGSNSFINHINKTKTQFIEFRFDIELLPLFVNLVNVLASQ